jgi:hypothetical protein
VIGEGLSCRELSISKLWQKQKKQTQQKLCTADHINNLGPPVQLGIMGPVYSKIFQSQIAVLNHPIESSRFIEKFSGGLHRDPSFDIYYPVLLVLLIYICLPQLCGFNSAVCTVRQNMLRFPSEFSVFMPTQKVE